MYECVLSGDLDSTSVDKVTMGLDNFQQGCQGGWDSAQDTKGSEAG